MRRLIAWVVLPVLVCLCSGLMVGCSQEADPTPESSKLNTVDGNGDEPDID